MNASSYGRILFGAAMVLFGVIALMWHDADTWQALHELWKLPFGTIVGDILMIALIIGGIGIVYPRTAHVASIVLIVVFILFSLACIPGILAAPRVFGQYDGFFEQFSLLCAAIVLYAANDGNARRATALAYAARVGLGLCVVSFTLAQIIYLRFTAALVPNWIPPSHTFWAILTTIAFALAAIAILINIQARLAMRLLTVMIVLFGVLVWIPLLIAQPQSHSNWSEFAINFLIAGAVWMFAWPSVAWPSIARTSSHAPD